MKAEGSAGPAIIYWELAGRKGPAYIIRFWTKKGMNELTFVSVTMDEDKIRARITEETGRKRFMLEFVKGK